MPSTVVMACVANTAFFYFTILCMVSFTDIPFTIPLTPYSFLRVITILTTDSLRPRATPLPPGSLKSKHLSVHLPLETEPCAALGPVWVLTPLDAQCSAFVPVTC